MKREDRLEAAKLVNRLLDELAKTVPASGRAGSYARAKISQTRANAIVLLATDTMGPELDACFTLSREAGCKLAQLEAVRRQADLEEPRTLGAILVCDCFIRLCLANECLIIATLDFVSRSDVEGVRAAMQMPFEVAIETAADGMDQMTFQALIGLYGATTAHLAETARPLPQILGYEFWEPLPSLVVSYRLYGGDATRADELRNENKIVHPAFCPNTGLALSA